MKKVYLLLGIPVLLAALLLTMYARIFETVRLENNIAGAVVYSYNGISFEEPLTQKQLAAAVQILNGRKLVPQNMAGIPNCPFSENVAIVLGDRRFLMACDDCAALQDVETGRYFEISDAERQTLEDIFVAHGGAFPCI